MKNTRLLAGLLFASLSLHAQEPDSSPIPPAIIPLSEPVTIQTVTVQESLASEAKATAIVIDLEAHEASVKFEGIEARKVIHREVYDAILTQHLQTLITAFAQALAAQAEIDSVQNSAPVPEPTPAPEPTPEPEPTPTP